MAKAKKVNVEPKQSAADDTPSVNSAPKPVTLQGKAVEPRTIDGKVRLRKMQGAKPVIITGFIPLHLAKQVIANNPNVEIVNENLEKGE